MGIVAEASEAKGGEVAAAAAAAAEAVLAADGHHEHGHEQLHACIGVSLVLGFVFMLLVDQIGSSHMHSAEGEKPTWMGCNDESSNTSTLIPKMVDRKCRNNFSHTGSAARRTLSTQANAGRPDSHFNEVQIIPVQRQLFKHSHRSSSCSCSLGCLCNCVGVCVTDTESARVASSKITTTLGLVVHAAGKSTSGSSPSNY